MVKTVVSTALPIGERVVIQKNRITPEGGERPGMKRLCLCTGTHGDELEGQYVCYLLADRIQKNLRCLKGVVDIYPALNPLGIDTITRGIPMFDLDMNRIFPGNNVGPMAEFVAGRIIEDIKGADCCVDVHASNVFLREVPQVRINEKTEQTLVPLARRLNVDYIWVHANATVLESTLAYSLNDAGVPTLVVEMGIGLRLTPAYCEQLADGLIALMAELGLWDGEVPAVKKPVESRDGEVHYCNAEQPGIFVPAVAHGCQLRKGQHIGDVLSPLTGRVAESILSPCDGWLFTLREYPVCYAGSLLARVLGGADA